MQLNVREKYRLLSQISHKIRDTLDLDEILNHLLDMLQTVVEYDAAGFFVLNQDLVHSRFNQPRDLIASVVWRGFPETPPESDPMLRLGKGIIGHVIRTGESVLVPDVRLDPRYVAGRPETLSEISVPVIRNDRPIGALNLESNRLDTYQVDDLEVLRFFSDAASISIEKAMLHRQLMVKERIEEQLRVARQIQFRLLPKTPPQISGYDIGGTCIPMYEIGGDYYDYLEMADNRLGLVVADVSGEGIPAALIMTAFRALLRMQLRSDANILHIAEKLNHLLPDFTGQVDFVTAVYGVLNLQTGLFQYVNCGHNPPLLLKNSGPAQKLNPGGPLLSILENPCYKMDEAIVAPGDILLLYTDGAVEVANQRDIEFGIGRLETALREAQALPTKAIIDQIVRSTRSFSGQEYYRDDFTMLVIKRAAPGPGL